VGEADAPDGRWIPILWMSVLFHDACGGTIVSVCDDLYGAR